MLPESKNFDFGICTSCDVSGCSLNEYPQNFNKAMQNLGKSNLVKGTEVPNPGVVKVRCMYNKKKCSWTE